MELCKPEVYMYNDMIEITVNALLDKKAYDIKALDITKLTSICDGFVIASASNKSQLDALVDGVETAMYKNEYALIGREGRSEGGWVLLDYGDIVVHLFSDEMREFYNIDGSWRDADTIVVKGA
jgi:ribosome-associated protein